MPHRSETTARLIQAFVFFFVLLGAASYTALSGLKEVHESINEVTRHNTGMRTALTLASAVRDQYAHQAHTIILGNDTHLRFHRAASESVRTIIRELDGEVSGREQRELLDEISRLSKELDEIFLARIVPAVLARDATAVEEEHGRALALVFNIQDKADRIATLFAGRITHAEAHASQVETLTFRWVAGSQLVALLFAAAMGVFIVRTVTRPLARLEAGAARLGSGDLDTHIDLPPHDEFGRLAAQLNAMTLALKEHQARLVSSEKLAAVGRLAAGVAHEINNPLGVILGYVRLLRRKAEGDTAGDLAVVEEEAVRCQLIVEGMLDLSRPWRLSPVQLDLRRLCREVGERLAEAQQGEGPSLTIQGEARVFADEHALRQVVLNLVKNAAEAAGPGGQVQVSLATLPGGGAVVEIADSGPGLPAEVKAKVFEAFFTTKSHGTGLGLAVSRAIVEAHSGTIEALSPPGGGATFRVTLPDRGRSEVSHHEQERAIHGEGARSCGGR